jgi:hypothetical protein
MKFRLSRLLVVLLGITAALALAPAPALAADLRQGSAITVPPGQTVRDDLYVGAGTVDVSGTVDGSLLATGGTITMSGTITRDLMVAGGMDLVAIVFGLGGMALTLPRFRRSGGTAGTASAPVGAAAPSPLR